jgi:hypothetical protein
MSSRPCARIAADPGVPPQRLRVRRFTSFGWGGEPFF